MMRTTRREQVLAYLRKFPVITLNIIGAIENNPAAEIFVDDEASPGGALVRSGRYIYLHTESDAVLDMFCAAFFRDEGCYEFSGVWRPLADKLRRRFPLLWDSPCRLYWLPAARLDTGRIASAVESLKPADAEFVDRHYQYRDDSSLDKIRESIARRPSAAVYAGGQPASWVLVHDDNSMGVMYTLDSYRKQGLAVDVTLSLAAKLIAAGQTPFLQIHEDNAMSPGLAEKCGFIPCGRADWFGIIVGASPRPPT